MSTNRFNAQSSVARLLSDENEYFTGTISAQMADDVKKLWADKGVQATYKRRAEFQLNDSAAYYFDAIERIAAEDYIPTEQDVLRSRAKTTGIIETEFEVDGVKFRMCDVGGQRSERKKWMHWYIIFLFCFFLFSSFDNVCAMLFARDFLSLSFTISFAFILLSILILSIAIAINWIEC